MAVHVGTSGWHYDHWRGVFYPPDLAKRRWLSWYASHFDVVEVNNTFYRLPRAGGLDRWVAETPDSFRFAVKGSRFLTHMKRLLDTTTGLERFFTAIAPLAAKQGPILWQLPPGWGKNADRLAAFLEALPREYRHAFEFRNPSWHAPDIYDLLRKHGAGFCVFELAGEKSPEVITADFAYVRLHGPGGKYAGCYDVATLREWARKVNDWPDTWTFFDNDQAGHAARNAAELRQILT